MKYNYNIDCEKQMHFFTSLFVFIIVYQNLRECHIYIFCFCRTNEKFTFQFNFEYKHQSSN